LNYDSSEVRNSLPSDIRKKGEKSGRERSCEGRGGEASFAPSPTVIRSDTTAMGGLSTGDRS